MLAILAPHQQMLLLHYGCIEFLNLEKLTTLMNHLGGIGMLGLC